MQMKMTAAIALAFAMVSSAAFAQNYPNRPITLLVPFAAGGATDTVARVTAQSMSKLLGQTDHHRERHGRRRHHRGHAGLARGAGRLHAADSPHRHLHGRHAVPQAALRHQDRVRADRPRHQRADDDHRAARSAAEHAGRAGHLHQGQRRQDDLRQCRPRRRFASLRHAVHDRRRQGNPDRALQGQCARHERPDRQADRPLLRPDHQHHGPIASKLVKAYAITTKTRLASMPDLPTRG